MFRKRLKNSWAFKLRFSCVLLCVILPNYASGHSNQLNASVSHGVYSNSLFFKGQADWKLAPVGKSASEFLRIFYLYSPNGAVKSTVQLGIENYNKFVHTLIGYTFIQQIPMTITVIVGCLCVLLLLLAPSFIVMYRNRQIPAFQEAEVEGCFVTPRQGWIVYEFFFVFLVIAIFGGILMCLSAVEFEAELPELFNFGVFALKSSFQIKEIILDHFYNSLFDVSHSAFEVIQYIYDVNDDVGDTFMKRINYRLKPVRYLAKSIQWGILEIKNTLKFEKQRLGHLKSSTDASIENITEEYRATLDVLKMVIENEDLKDLFESHVNSLIDIPSYSSNSTFEVIDAAIDRLDVVAKVDFQNRLLNVTHYLRSSIGYSNFDPSEIMEALRQIAFDIESKIRVVVSNYVTFIDAAFTTERKDEYVNLVEYTRDDVSKKFSYFTKALLIVGIISVSLGIFFFIVYSAGVWGTRGFRIRSSGVTHRSGLSHGSGKIIVIFIYISVIFLALFWSLSICIFLLSSVPFELCLSSKDKSLFAVTLDYPSFHQSRNWYSMYSSERFNSTLYNNVIQCEADDSYFRPLPDPIVNRSLFNRIKNVDMSSVTEKIENVVQNLPSITISESEMSSLNLVDVLNFDVHLYFNSEVAFLQTLESKNASAILAGIKNNPASTQKVVSAVQTVIKSYESIVDRLSTTAADADYLDTLLKTLNVTLKILATEIDQFQTSTKTLVHFLETNTTSIYTSVLNETLVDLIDGVYYNLELSTRQFRQSISFCSSLNLFYDKFVHIMCERLLYPVSACWLGSFFVDVFLLLSVFLCLYSVPLFLIPAKVNPPNVPPPVIRPEDIASTSFSRMDPSPRLSKIKTSGDNRTSLGSDPRRRASTSKILKSTDTPLVPGKVKSEEITTSRSPDNESSLKNSIASSEPSGEESPAEDTLKGSEASGGQGSEISGEQESDSPGNKKNPDEIIGGKSLEEILKDS